MALELGSDPKSSSHNTPMVLLTSAPLPGLQGGLTAQEGPCSVDTAHAWSSLSQGWRGWRSPTTHSGTSMALTMRELSAVM